MFVKYKSYLIGISPAFVFLAVVLFETQNTPIRSFGLREYIIVLGALVGSLCLVWYRFVEGPIRDLTRSLRRAIQGDYQARFSCDNRNGLFYQVSQLFNQFMDFMEQQTEEVAKTRRLQTQMYENEKIYRSALELTCERVFEADLAHNRFLYGQEQYSRHFSFLQTELYDDIIRFIAERAVFEEDVEQYRNTFQRANLMQIFKEGPIREVNLEYREKTPDGTVQWRMATVIHLSDSTGDSMKVIGYVKDIDSRKRNELEMIQLSQKDGLTGLYNKKFTQSLCESYLAGEGSQSISAAIMIDVDNFKSINDTLGHIEGDHALERVSNTLQCVFHGTDIIGRIGGDEFFVLFKEYSSRDALLLKLNRLLESLDEIRLGPEQDFPLSASVGVSLYPEDGKTYSELYVKADTSLYYAKQHGKKRFYICGGPFALEKKESV